MMLLDGDRKGIIRTLLWDGDFKGRQCWMEIGRDVNVGWRLEGTWTSIGRDVVARRILEEMDPDIVAERILEAMNLNVVAERGCSCWKNIGRDGSGRRC